MAKLITNPEQIRLRDDSEVQALLGHPPSRLTKWGITIIAVGVFFLLSIAQFLRYPDIVEAPAVIQTESPAIRLEAKTDGSIAQLWVSNQETVDSGRLLVELQNPVSLQDIQQVRNGLAQLIPALQEKDIQEIHLPHDLHLAALQTAYSQLTGLLESQQYLLQKDDARRKITLLQQQIVQLAALNRISEQEINTLREEVKIAEDKKKSYEALIKTDAASQLEANEATTSFLRYRRELEAKERDHINNLLREQELRTQIITLAQEDSNDLKRGWVQLEGAAQQMKGALEEWEDIYLISAPIAGKVVLSRFWSKNQAVNSGESVLTIDPGQRPSRIIARAMLPVGRAGKVKPGQQVLLRLPSYPYKEFGVLEGSVEQIVPLPESSGDDQIIYPLLITLTSDSLQTTTGSIIPFTQELPATARIITTDRSFLERILDEVLSAFREN